MMKLSNCSECGGKIVKKKVDYKVYGVSLGKFPAEVCLQCGEILFNESAALKIEKIEKEKGLWGLQLRETGETSLVAKRINSNRK
ncbi:MAG: hypothetical protein G01um101448_1234 [Parcubacteria group bacterium Gr01-1014_48]|nr:MAG: hypothetical protein G01um101448_1234 [Parcubacteria group bacterium Gr01-1014_48]